MLSAALCASCTCQNTMASTFTGTVSRVSACSALKPVVWMRSSMTAAMLSITGMIMNRPGPLTLESRPARRMTKRSQLFAIFSAKKTKAAAIAKTTPGTSRPDMIRPAATAASTTVIRRVMGFIGELPVAGRAPAGCAGSLRRFRDCRLQMREAFRQQRAVVVGWREGLVGADIIEPGGDARQVTPVGHIEVMHAHQLRHDGDVGEADVLAEQPRTAALADLGVHALPGAAQAAKRRVHLLLGKTGLAHRQHELAPQRLRLGHGDEVIAAHRLELGQESQIEGRHPHRRR